MVGLGRVELPTSPLSGARSNQLSYRPDLFGSGLFPGVKLRAHAYSPEQLKIKSLISKFELGIRISYSWSFKTK